MKTSLTFLVGSLFCLPVALAQNWDGGGTNDNISNADNWNPAAAPANDGTAAVVFDGTNRLAPVFDAAWDLFSIAFDGTSSFSLAGDSLTLGGLLGGLLDAGLTLESSPTQTIANNIALARSQTWESTQGGGLDITGEVDLAGSDLRGDFGSGSLVLKDGGRILGTSDSSLDLASGSLILQGANDNGSSATVVDRIGNDVKVVLSGGELVLVSDNHLGQPSVFVNETIDSLQISGDSRVSVESSANHVEGARLDVASSVNVGDQSTLRASVEGNGNELELGSSTTVRSGGTMEASMLGGGNLDTNVLINEGGVLNMVGDSTGRLVGFLINSGDLDFDSANGPEDFEITSFLTLNSSSSVSMAIGGSGSTQVDVGGDLNLDGTLSLTEDSGAPLTDSGLHTIFTYADDLTDNGIEMAGGPDFSGNPDWKFAVTTAVTAGEVDLVVSEVRDWDGGGPDNNLGTAANWDADKALAQFDYLNIDPSQNTAVTNDLVAGTTLGGLEIGGSNNNEVILGGNQLNLSSGIIVQGGDQTFDLDLTPNYLDFESDSVEVNSGTATFNGDVSVTPGLNLTVRVADGSSVTFNGDISGSKLFKTGTSSADDEQSTLTLTGIGTFDGGVAGSSVAEGDLILTGANGALVLSGKPQLDLLGLPEARSRLILDNSVDNNEDRISNNTGLTMFGNSAVRFVGHTTDTASERISVLALFDGVTTFDFDSPSNVASGIVFDNLQARTALNYLKVTDSSGALGDGGNAPFLKFDAGLSHNELIARGNYNGTDLLLYDSANGLGSATSTTTMIGAGSSDNVRLDASETLNSSQTIRSLALNGSTLDGTGTLTVDSGLILVTAGSELAVTTDADSSSGVTIYDARGDSTLSAALTSANDFEKWGEGVLTLSGLGEIVSARDLSVYEGALAMGRDNAIDPSTDLDLLNGTTLDLGSHDLQVDSMLVSQGGQVLGTGTLTARRLSVGPQAVIDSDVAFDSGIQRNSTLTSGSDLAFSGSVDFGENTRAFVSNDSVWSFNGPVVANYLAFRTSSSSDSSEVVFNDTFTASAVDLRLSEGTFRLNGTATLTGSSSITTPILRVESGRVALSGANGSLAGVDSLILDTHRGNSSEIEMDNSVSANSDRIDNTTTISMVDGTTLRLIGNASTDVTEVLGTVSMDGRNSFLDLAADSGAKTTLQITQLNRDAENVLHIDTSGGTLGAGATGPALLIDSQSSGLIDRTIVNDSDFASYDLTDGVKVATTASTFVGATSADNVRISASENVSTPASVESLVLDGDTSIDGADITLAAGHLMTGQGSSVSNNLTLSGDGFLYARGDSSLSGNVAIAGNGLKMGDGILTVGSNSTSLSVGSGDTLTVVEGSIAAGGDSAIANGTNVLVKNGSSLRTDFDLDLGTVTVQDGSDLEGTGSIAATTLTIDPNRNGGDYNRINIEPIITGATNLDITTTGESRNNDVYLQSISTYTGTTTIGRGADLKVFSSGAIQNSSSIDLNSTGRLALYTTDTIGDTVPISLADRSSIFLESWSGNEVVGAITIADDADVSIRTYSSESATITASSVTIGNDAFLTLSSGNNDILFASTVTSRGSSVSDGDIVEGVLRNNGPVEWQGTAFRALTPQVVTSFSSSPPTFAEVNSVFDLTADADVKYLKFSSTDPFNSTPGTTLTVQRGLFFTGTGEKGVNANVALGSDSSISTESGAVTRFNNEVSGTGAVTLLGGGQTIIDADATVTGLTSVNEGSLVVGDQVASTFTGDISVRDGASIGGSGTVDGALTIDSGGSTQPGNSPGTLSIIGDLEYEAGSFAGFELASIGSSDLISVDGGIFFNGITLIQLTPLENVTTGIYTLFDYTVDLTGFSFLGIDENVGLALNEGFAANLVHDISNKEIDLNITSLGVTAVPEPAAMVLLVSLGTFGFVMTRRRRSGRD